MPIYDYLCENCGFQQDVLQKMSDPRLTDCPQCKQPTLKKQLTAAGFQLKGSGWYVTDFRDNGKKTAAPAATAEAAKDGAAQAPVVAPSGSADAPAPATAPAAAPAPPASHSASSSPASSSNSASSNAATGGSASKS